MAKLNILLVDDDELIIESLQILIGKNHNVMTFTSSADAIDYAKENNAIDLAISDYKMSGINGAEFLAEIEKINSDIIRIVLSGHTGNKEIKDLVESGTIQKAISKPWNPKYFLVMLENYSKNKMKMH